MRAIVLAALLAALLAAPPAAVRSDAPDDDADSDPAAYLIIITHENGWQCSASLISRVTAVTAAACARAGAGEQLWALAARLPAAAAAPPALLAAGARRVARAALAGAGRDADPADLAVLELEAPFGAEAEARPILAAAPGGGGGGGCAAARECHTLRARAAAGARRVRFRVGSAARAPAARCAARVPHWAAADSLLCYTGDELCERDLGGGVVCGGYLCGVLSAVAGAGAAGAEGEAGEAGAGRCGDTFAAQDIARWRRFLHCAHSVGLCGRSTCKTVCSERRLLDDADSFETVFTSGLNVSSANISPDVHSSAPPRAAPAAHSMLREDNSVTSTFRPTVEFEPNRADFKVTPSRTSHAGLKAGEYGDNAADYGGEEPALHASSTARSDRPPARTARPSACTARPPARATRPPARAAPSATLATPPAPALREATALVLSSGASSLFTVPFMLISNCLYTFQECNTTFCLLILLLF